ncbi:MAG: hypothetical protein ACOYO2_07105, partial [Mycobacterium sp.]
MGDRRVLLGTSAVLVGLGSALISGTAVAAAETGEGDSKPDTSASGSASSAPAAASRRANTRTRPTPVVAPANNNAANDNASAASAPTATRGVRLGNRAARIPAARVNPEPTAAVPTVIDPQPAVVAAAVVGRAMAAAAPPDPTPFEASAAADPLLPGDTNGVTGVQVGHSRLEIPGAFIGNTVAADWYFPTQTDGTIDAQGVIWLQHGFGASNTLYSALATDLAQRTNSIVVAPTLTSLPFTFSGGCLICSTSQQAVAEVFLDPDRTALVTSAQDAGYNGDVSELLGAFMLSGHSAGGGFATATAADYVTDGSDAQDAD